MDEAAQEGAGGQDHRAGADFLARRAVTTPATRPSLEDQILGGGGSNVEVRLLGQQRLHRLAVELAVGLGARAPHRRALAAVENAELDAGAVGRPGP